MSKKCMALILMILVSSMFVTAQGSTSTKKIENSQNSLNEILGALINGVGFITFDVVIGNVFNTVELISEVAGGAGRLLVVTILSPDMLVSAMEKRHGPAFVNGCKIRQLLEKEFPKLEKQYLDKQLTFEEFKDFARNPPVLRGG